MQPTEPRLEVVRCPNCGANFFYRRGNCIRCGKPLPPEGLLPFMVLSAETPLVAVQDEPTEIAAIRSVPIALARTTLTTTRLPNRYMEPMPVAPVSKGPNVSLIIIILSVLAILLFIAMIAGIGPFNITDSGIAAIPTITAPAPTATVDLSNLPSARPYTATPVPPTVTPVPATATPLPSPTVAATAAIAALTPSGNLSNTTVPTLTIATNLTNTTVPTLTVASNVTTTILPGNTAAVLSPTTIPASPTPAPTSTPTPTPILQAVQVLSGHTGKVNAVAFSPDSTLLASASIDKDETVKLWDVASKQPKQTLASPNRGIFSLTFLDNQTLVGVGEDGSIFVWDVTNGQLLATYEDGQGQGPLNSVAYDSTEKLLAMGAANGTCKLWDFSNPSQATKVQEITVGNVPVEAVVFSPDGKTLATGGDDNIVRLWSIASKQASSQPIATLTRHTAAVYSLAFSADGKTLASGSLDETARLWNASSGKILQTLQAKGQVWSVAFSPSGKTLLTGTDNLLVQLWDVSSGKMLAQNQTESSIRSVAFSPDGKYFVAGEANGGVKLWAFNGQ